MDYFRSGHCFQALEVSTALMFNLNFPAVRALRPCDGAPYLSSSDPMHPSMASRKKKCALSGRDGNESGV